MLKKEAAFEASNEVAQRLLAYGKLPGYVAKMTKLPLKQVHEMASNQLFVQMPPCEATD